MEKTIASITRNKTHCFFISPHFDDAALSAGGLMTYLSDKTKVTVINVFTKSELGPQTLSAKKTISNSQYANSKELYDVRTIEDKEALSSINVEVINVPFMEALWRKIEKPNIINRILGSILPEFLHVYPNYKLHIASGNISKHDRELLQDLVSNLKKHIPKDAVVFCPIGVGNHVDHVVTRKAVEMAFDPIYWLDQPYDFRNAESIDTSEEFVFDSSKKIELLSFYKSQMPLLFDGDTIPHLSERFIVKPQSTLPQSITSFTFVKEILKDKVPKPFVYGLYQNKDGETAFAKQWIGTIKNKNYYLLRNEINAYKILNETLSQYPEIRKKFPTIEIPSHIHSVEENNSLTLLLSEVKGAHLGTISSEKKLHIYNEIFSFFEYMNSLKLHNRNSIMIRNPFYWMLLLPFISTIAFLKHSYMWKQILQANIVAVTTFATVLSNHRNAIVHRDLGDWNVLVNGNKIHMYDFQLMSIAHPFIDYATTILKSWSGKPFALALQKNLLKKYSNGSTSMTIFKYYAICLGIYELSITDNVNKSVTIDYLKHHLTMNNTVGNLNLFHYIQLLIDSPKDFIFTYLTTGNSRIEIKPYDSKVERIVKDITDRMNKAVPELKINLIGSASLKIDGLHDIDMVAGCSQKNVALFAKKLTEVLGKPTKIRHEFVEWEFSTEGYHVAISLMNELHGAYNMRLKMITILKNHPEVLEKYIALKKSLNGSTEKEYLLSRMLFFNNMLKNYN